MEEYRIYESYMMFSVLAESFKFPVNPMLKPYYKTTVEAESFEDAIRQYQEWKGQN